MTIGILILVYMNKYPTNTEKPKQLMLSFNNKKLYFLKHYDQVAHSYVYLIIFF